MAVPRFKLGPNGPTAAQRRFFDEYGFVVYANVLTEKQIVQLRTEAERLTRATLRGEIPKRHRDDLIPTMTLEDGRQVVNRLPYFTLYSPEAQETVESLNLRSIGPGLLGPGAWLLEDTMHGTIWQMKRAGSSYSRIRWHIDFEDDHPLCPVVSAGIYLNESTLENGCLLVIPGSHRFAPTRFPGSALPVEVEPGDIVCHAHGVFHSSGPSKHVDSERATLYLYFCQGTYPGRDLPFAPPDRKVGVRSLFVGN